MQESNISIRKRTKPNFVVKESKFSARVKSRWRFPRGKHSAVRQRHKGRPALPQPGYGSSNRGLSRQGLKKVIVSTVKDLKNIDLEREAAIISGKVGGKRRLQLLKLAQKKSITLLNVKDIATLQKKIIEVFDARKKLRQQKLKDKGKKFEEKKKKAEEKKKKEEVEKEEKDAPSVEDKLKKEEEKQKELLEKTITKRQ